MKRLVSFFEIPASNFQRAIAFYESLLGVKMEVFECETEKMAFFPAEEGKCPGAISWAENFKPSENGVLVSLTVESIDRTEALILQQGGKVIIPKTKIQAEDRGYFLVFTDSEGNKLGIYED